MFLNEIHDLDIRSLYHNLIKHHYSASIIFKPQSSTYREFGQYVTGWLFLTKYDIAAIENDTQIRDSEKIRIISFDENLSSAQKHAIKYKGVPIQDIDKIIYFPYSEPQTLTENNKKVLSNVIQIPFEGGKADWEQIHVNYFFPRIMRGEELLYFEIDLFMGIFMAIYDRRIPGELMARLNLTPDKIHNNTSMMKRYLTSKKSRKGLTEFETNQLDNLTAIHVMSNFHIVLKEFFKSNPTISTVPTDSQAINQLMKALSEFQPEIISYDGKTTYWNEQSYVHICMRHMAEMQVGEYKEKTQIPYEPDDLKLLIERIQHQVAEEIKTHFSKFPDKEFFRENRMAIPYEGDYFCIRIAPDGRIVTFYPLGEQNMQPQ